MDVMRDGPMKRLSNKDRKMFFSPTYDLAANIKGPCQNMNVAEEMPAYSSMPGFMCRRVFDVQGSRCSGLLWWVNARSFAQLGPSGGGCKLSFLLPTE